MTHSTDVVVRTSDGGAVIEVQESVYTLEALFKACYLFTDRCYLFLKRANDTLIEVHITPKNNMVSLDCLVGEFCNELIDQRLRADISRESGKLREIIVAQAFAEGNLLESSGPGSGRDDYHADPLGIGDSSDHGR
jgi:His-Xaa-Ser system protein HxsD